MKTNFSKKKLLLINPFNSYQRDVFFNTNTISPPLGLGIISALTPDNWDIEILDENFDEFKYKDADLIGLTALTSAVNRAYDIAGIYKQKGIPTVIGGIHASMLPDEALKYIDTVVIGEAESVWPKLIRDFENKKLKRVYQGELLSLENLPIPRRDLFHPGYNISNIQTSRGCPMNCDFCSVHTFNGNKYRHRPIKNVLDDLETIKHDNVFVVDDNIIGYSKKSTERAIKLFKGIIDRGIKKDWVCQASLNIADNEEVLKYAALSGCRMILIGIESEKTRQLQEVNKKMNIKIGVNNYKNVFQKIHKYGISVLGTFIYGLDNDSLQDLDNRSDYIISSDIDAIQSTILTPLPGTRLFNRLLQENRLLYTNFPKDWEHYHFMEVIHKPKLMTAEELQEAMVKNWKKLYEKKLMQRKLLKSIKSTKNIKAAVWAYFANLERHNLCLGKKTHPVDIEKMLIGLRKT